MDRSGFGATLAAVTTEIGAHSIASLSLDNPDLRRRINENSQLVQNWLQQGGHAQMDYLERMFVEKADPWSTFPFARSVLVVTFTNLWGDAAATHPFPLPEPGAPVGYLSAYARNPDYHRTGQSLLAALKARLGDVGQAEALVDTGAVYERLLAAVGGLGVHGSNDLLRVPELGCRAFIGCLFVEESLPEVILDPQLPMACDACHACLNNCPTAAIQLQSSFRSNRCISYLTIEKRDVLTREEAASIGDWIFGCDNCTQVCPPVPSTDLRIPVDLEWLLTSPASEVRRTIDGTAVAYAGVTRLRRNAVVALNNARSERAGALLEWVAENSGSSLILRQIEQL